MIGIVFGALVILYLIVSAADNRGMGRPGPPVAPPTVAEAYADFEKLRSSGNNEEAIAAGKKLVATHPGTAEAGKAAGQLERAPKGDLAIPGRATQA